MKDLPAISIKTDCRIDVCGIELLPIEPCGQVSGAVESLSSYLCRLAVSHWLTPTNLYLEMHRRAFGRTPRALKCDSRVDGSTRTSELLAQLVGTYSPISFDFQRLTYLGWKTTFAASGAGLLSKNLKWCPECLAHDEEAKSPKYHRLLWNIAALDVCPEHETLLLSQCPHCAHRQEFVVSRWQVGYCQWCGHRLTHHVTRSRPGSDEQLWKARACNQMVHAMSDGHSFETTDFRRNLDEVAKHYKDSDRRIARSLNLPPDTIRSWRARGHRPRFDRLLDFCYRVDIPPTRFFERTPDLITHKQRVVPSKPYPKRVYLGVDDRSRIRRELRSIIASANELSSSEDVAKKVGITRGVLQRRFPAEAADVALRVKRRRAREKRERDQARVARIREGAQQLVSAGVYPSDRQMKKHSNVLASDLRLPQVKVVLREIQQTFLDDRPELEGSTLMKRITGSDRIVPSEEEVRAKTQTYDPRIRRT